MSKAVSRKNSVLGIKYRIFYATFVENCFRSEEHLTRYIRNGHRNSYRFSCKVVEMARLCSVKFSGIRFSQNQFIHPRVIACVQPHEAILICAAQG